MLPIRNDALFFSIVIIILLHSVRISFAMTSKRILRVAEPAWRAAVAQHRDTIHTLLQPGLTPHKHALNSGKLRQQNVDHIDRWTALDPLNPVYNFLIEYYGLKGAKGPRRLARWSPSPALILGRADAIDTVEELLSTSQTKTATTITDESIRCGGILLEGANPDDLGTTLHLRGSMPHPNGVVYSPHIFFNQAETKAANPFYWYRSILQQTLTAEPVLHCHGLHEWAMQYWPDGAEPPPSQKYQKNIPLRVSQQTINRAVERRGISCTHVDALRFFAPAAGPLNHHGSSLTRQDQLKFEQPACVHAHMDLLKMSMRLQPYCDPVLVQRVLSLALSARTLDVAASPYDASCYHVEVIPIETFEGRAIYRQQQVQLMVEAKPIREELLRAYDLFLAFGGPIISPLSPDPERFARAEPGGLPWRKNLIDMAEGLS